MEGFLGDHELRRGKRRKVHGVRQSVVEGRDRRDVPLLTVDAAKRIDRRFPGWMGKREPWTIGLAGDARGKPATHGEVTEVIEMVLIQLVLPHRRFVSCDDRKPLIFPLFFEGILNA
jgi:hypothetical protein